jgi:cob(I)alamin adenosyltransferase
VQVCYPPPFCECPDNCPCLGGQPPWFLGAMDELLNPIRNDLAAVRNDLAAVRNDLGVVRNDLAVVSNNLAVVTDDLAVVRDDVAGMREQLTVLQADVACGRRLAALVRV